MKTGYYRQENGGVALAIASDGDPIYPLRGICNINTDSACDAAWDKKFKYSVTLSTGRSLVEFIAPFEIPSFPAFVLIDGVGTYLDLNGIEWRVVSRACDTGWVAVDNGGFVHQFSDDGKQIKSLLGNVISVRLDRKISDEI